MGKRNRHRQESDLLLNRNCFYCTYVKSLRKAVNAIIMFVINHGPMVKFYETLLLTFCVSVSVFLLLLLFQKAWQARPR